MGNLIEGLFELIDQYESEVNGMRTIAAMRENARRGFVNGSQPPYGFKVEKVRVAGQEAMKGKLVLNPVEADVVREVFRLYIEGCGAKTIARKLNERGVRYRRGALWRKDHVLKVLEEEAAAGCFYWDKSVSSLRELNDREDWIAITVEPVITREVFEMAQKLREHNDPKKHPGRGSSSPMLLANLVRCGRCGDSYQLETSGKLKANGDYRRYYNCRGYVRTGKEKCAGYRIPMEVLDRGVLEHFSEKLFTPERCRAILRDVVEETGLLRQRATKRRDHLRKELDAAERALRKWENAFETDALPSDLGLDRVRELKARREELARELRTLAPAGPPPGHLYTDATIARFQESVREVFLSGDTALARNYLRFLVDRIVVTGPKVEIQGKSVSAVRMMAEPDRLVFTGGAPVQATVEGWLPESKFYRTWIYVKDFPPLRLVQPAPEVAPRPRRPSPEERAHQYQAMLDAEPGLTRAALARRLGVSRAWVTKVLGRENAA